ncbi:MAG: GDP-L-fucose synthase [Pseudomonadota bacterium]
MFKDSKIYVAGHRGLVGSALMKCLAAEGFSNVITRTHSELDLTDQAEVKKFFQEEKPEYVFLAAAKVGGILANNTYPAEFIYQNLAIQQNVIHQSWKSGVKRLLFLGSSCIYPRDCAQPIKEEYLLTGPLEATNRPYAVAKIAGIEMCWAYNRQYGTKFLAVMPTNLYGPGDNYDLEKSHVLPALIRKFHLAKLAAERNWTAIEQDEIDRGPIPEDIKRQLYDTCHLNVEPRVCVWGTGAPHREFLYSEDMARACLFLMNLPDDKFQALLCPAGSPLESCLLNLAPLINIGCGRDQTIKTLVDMVKEVVSYEGPVVWDTTKPDGTPRKLLDADRLFSYGWRPETSLFDGVQLAYEDYLATEFDGV